MCATCGSAELHGARCDREQSVPDAHRDSGCLLFHARPSPPPLGAETAEHHSRRMCFEAEILCQARGSFYTEGWRSRQTETLGWGEQF